MLLTCLTWIAQGAALLASVSLIVALLVVLRDSHVGIDIGHFLLFLLFRGAVFSSETWSVRLFRCYTEYWSIVLIP